MWVSSCGAQGDHKQRGYSGEVISFQSNNEGVSMRGFLTVIAWSCLIVTAQASAQSGPPFPRLGGYLIGSPQSYQDSTYQAQVARLNFAIFGAWPGWSGSPASGASLQQAVLSIKAINPNIKIINYTLIDSVPPKATVGNPSYGATLTKVNAMNWWAYVNGTSGTIATSSSYPQINITNFVPADGTGELYTDWHANWSVANLMTPWPALDGLFTDNVGWQPAVPADWNRDGTTDTPTNATVGQWFRQGFQRFFNDLAAQLPGKLLLGNINNWGNPGSTLTEYNQLLQGGVIEGLVGQSWSPETWAGWAATLAWYRKTMAAVAAPKLVLFHQIDSPTNYQGMRYGLATCLMDDGYYEFIGTDYHTILWFDEYNASLGQATSPPPTAAWQSGVWRRDFQNGIALVNPKGNGIQTVTLETSYQRIKGTQVPSINNGQTATTVTLQDRDGIILMRVGAAATTTTPAVPAAPGSMSVTTN
jgi:hypothetical protein